MPVAGLRSPFRLRPASSPALAFSSLASLAVVLLAPPAAAHEVVVDVAHREAVILTLAEEDGTPFADEAWGIYLAGEEAPYRSGRTDGDGRIVFVPELAGTWRLLAASAHGHGVDVTFEISEGGGVSVGERSRFDRAPRLLAGLGYVLGAFGILQLVTGRRRSAATAA